MLDLWFLKQNKTHNFFFKRKNRMILDDIGNFNYMKFLKYPLEKKYIEDGINNFWATKKHENSRKIKDGSRSSV